MDFYGHVDGILFRVQADKPPDKEMIEALHAMVRCVHKMKFTKPKNSQKWKNNYVR